MRKFIGKPFGEEYDLDDINIYDYLPNDVKLLDDLMFKEIGYALCYMDYFHPDVFDDKIFSGNQKERVINLIKDFTENRINHYSDVNWYKEKIFLFQDEINNMC
jgi:uncharacterized membrane protein